LTKRVNQDRSEGVDGNISEALLADMRGMLWKHVGKDGDFREFAEQANVSKVTILRFMWHNPPHAPQTKRPQFETVVRILWALGRKDLLAKVFEGPHKPLKWGRKK